MCAVSMVVDYYRDRSWQGAPPFPYNPQPLIQPIIQWDQESKELLRQALAKLDQLDKRLNDIECNEPGKAKLKEIIGDWE